MRLVLISALAGFFLIGCGKSKLEIENEQLHDLISTTESRLHDAQGSVQSAKSDIEDLQDKIRRGNFYGILGDLEDIGDELDSVDSELDDVIGELR